VYQKHDRSRSGDLKKHDNLPTVPLSDRYGKLTTTSALHDTKPLFIIAGSVS